MTETVRNRAAIVGIGSTRFAKNLGKSELENALEASRLALEDAGLSPADVDAIFKVETPGEEGNSELEIARNLGIPRLRSWGAAGYGGGGACAPIVLAALAIATGMASVALAIRARNRGSGGRPWARVGSRVPGVAAFEVPYGLASPVQQIAALARRYMWEYGVTPEDLATVAVVQRFHASHNPHATFRDPITVDDVLRSRVVADPLHLLDCSMESDGACAVVLTTAQRARDLRHRPVLVTGVAQGMGKRHYMMGGLLYQDDPFDFPARYTAQEVYRSAGLGPGDIDVALLYDVFTPLVLWQLECYGFCRRGEAAALVREGRTRWPEGDLPVNTHGGSLSEAYIHGFNHVLEAVRQLRGEAYCQVAGARVALVAAAPIVPSSAVILTRE
ncbi:MAG TPA: lipid-transfer protein [Dehalococcoidia bacterium]|nr:lipid-transfer protein [Dehalococcoidia bacterium]